MDAIPMDVPGPPPVAGEVMPQRPDTGGTTISTRRLVLLLAAVAVLVYLNSLLNGFALDDVYIIPENQRVRNILDFRQIWLTPYWPEFGRELGVYRPFIIFLFAIQWAIGRGEPWVFHATNVLLHAGVTLLIFALLMRLLPRIPAAVGALIFAVHPVHTEAVANVVGQAEIVITAALVGACLIHASRPTGVAVSWPRRGALLALYLVGLFTKENAIVLPGLLVLLDFAQHRVELSRRGLLRYADAMLMPIFLLAAGFAFYSTIRLDVLAGAYVGEDTGPQLAFLKQHRLLNALRAFPEFMRLLFFPAQLSADYSPAVILPVESMTPMAALGLMLLAGLILLALLTPSSPGVGFPAGWFLIGISVVSNLFFPVGILVAERTLYLPSVAVAALAAYAWSAIHPRLAPARRDLLRLGLAVVVLALGVRTWVRNPDWASTSTVFSSIVRDRTVSYKAQWALAASHQSAGQRLLASLHYEAAYRVYPHNSELLTEYGSFLINQGRYDRAVQLLETAHRMHPRVMRSASMLAYAYLAAGRFREALVVIAHMERIGGPLAVSMPMRAYAWDRLGQPDHAAAAWRVALRQPRVSNWRNWSYLARSLALGGHLPGAVDAAARAALLATDTAAAAQVNRLIAALREGCYRPLARWRPAPSDSPAGPPLPPCDPLGDWFHDVGGQSAKPLQNASVGIGQGP